jgi:2'-5' RNA ligase
VRLFSALLLPQSALDAIEAWYPKVLADRPGTRRVRRENLHLTLRFFGEFLHEDAIRILEDAWASCAALPLEFMLTGTGCFNDSAVWVGGSFSPGVYGLAKAAGNRSFVPHVTIARLSGGHPPALPPVPPGISGFLDGMALFESTLTPRGPVYRVVSRWVAEGLP